MEKPKYTLLYNTTTADGFISRCRAFFINKNVADHAYNINTELGKSPILRPYSGQADRKYLVDYKKPIKVKK